MQINLLSWNRSRNALLPWKFITHLCLELFHIFPILFIIARMLSEHVPHFAWCLTLYILYLYQALKIYHASMLAALLSYVPCCRCFEIWSRPLCIFVQCLEFFHALLFAACALLYASLPMGILWAALTYFFLYLLYSLEIGHTSYSLLLWLVHTLYCCALKVVLASLLMFDFLRP